MKKEIVFATILLGVTAMGAQIVLLRQLIVVFYGNEISLGVFLSAWLFWGAIGSWVLGRLADKICHRQFSYAFCQLVLAFALTASLFAIRSSRVILGVLPGEIIGFLPMAAFSFAVLALNCIILGFLFALACRIYPAGQQPAAQIGRVYILEALGAGCGGCLISLFLIRYLDAFYLILGLAALNAFSAYLLLRKCTRPKIGIRKEVALGVVIFILFLLFSQKATEIKNASIKNQWRHLDILATEDSIYSNLIVSKRDEQYSFFSNGLYLFTVPDYASSEEAVHFALLETAQPKRVLLIGAGIGGLAQEALKHPLDELHYVEADPAIIDLGRRLLPKERLRFLEDGRQKIFHQDGRLFIKRAPALGGVERYDSIIVYLGDPHTAQINRFYTKEFFQEVQRRLKPEGVFSFGLSSAENFLNPEQKQFLSSIYRTLKSVFAEVKIIPGGTAYFLATDKEGTLTYDYKELTRRLRARKIQTKFVREYYLFDKLSPGRMAYLEQRIKDDKAQLNTDFRPISYYYDMVLWSTHFAGSWRKILGRVNANNLWGFFLCLYLCILIFGWWQRRRGLSCAASPPVFLAVSTTGFAELSFLVVTMLSFQIIYGYLYYKLGILLSFFMLGLLGGSWVMTRNLSRLKDDYGLFIKTQGVISVYPLILPLAFYALNKASANHSISWLGSNIIFPLLPLVAGFVGGLQFPLANKIVLKGAHLVGRTSGLSYGMDLLGSCAGAFLVSAFLLPLLGVAQTCLAVALLNTAVLITLLINRKK